MVKEVVRGGRKNSPISLWFSSISLCPHRLKNLLRQISGPYSQNFYVSTGLGWDLRIYISNKLSDDAVAML